MTCLVCGGSAFRPFLDCGTFRYVRCVECGLALQDPYPTRERIRAIYGGSYFEYERENEEAFFRLMLLGLSDAGFEKHPFSGSLFVDAGCATGRLLRHVGELGWKAKGVEVCRESAEFGMKNYGVDIFVGEIEEARLPDSSVDCFHNSHLIEHLPDPMGFLREAWRVLKPDGLLVITTPCLSGWQARAYGRRWRGAINQHLQLFDRGSFLLALRRAGFEVLRRVSWGGIPIESPLPGRLKRAANRLAKRFDVGDVQLAAARRAT